MGKLEKKIVLDTYILFSAIIEFYNNYNYSIFIGADGVFKFTTCELKWQAENVVILNYEFKNRFYRPEYFCWSLSFKSLKKYILYWLIKLYVQITHISINRKKKLNN